MAEQIPQAEENQDTEAEEQVGFIRRNGKYFLIAVILLVQAGGSYWAITSYYNNINSWLDELTKAEKLHFSFEDIIINPAGSNGERYLLLTVVVEVSNNSDLEQLEIERAKIVDRINQVLSAKNARQLTSFEDRNDLKQEIGITINKALDKKAVRNLFFTKYVLQ